MKVVPCPSEWLEYKQRPEMEGKTLGVFAHVFTNPGDEDEMKRTYRRVVDVAVEEENCLILSGSQSLIRPAHVLLYEEWTDYDEFFQVQLHRPYRQAYGRWMFPLMAEPVRPEFSEVLYSSGEHPVQLAPNGFCVLQSVHVKASEIAAITDFGRSHAADVSKDAENLVATFHRSLNNPQHFMFYEVWSSFDHLISIELPSERRSNLSAELAKLSDPDAPEPALELLQVYYDPGKFKPDS